MVKKSPHLILTVLVFIIFTLGYILFLQTPWFQHFFAWSQQNLALFIIVLFFLKVIGNVYPPLPGGMLTIAAIPFLGWKTAYLVDFFGSQTGGYICYVLGKKYGNRILNAVFDDSIVQKIHRLKLKPGREIEGIIMARLLTGGTIVEAIYYAAGFLNVKLRNFFIGTCVSHIIFGIPIYYLGGSFFSSGHLFVNGLFVVAALFILYTLRGRYFE